VAASTFTSPKNQQRPAIVEAKPFGQLLRDVAAYSGRQGNIVGNALVFLALTFVRPGTVTQAEWDEFDLAAALWTVPFKKLKQRKFREGIDELRGKPHFVPLSRQAVVLLHDLKKQGGDGAYVFPGRKTRPISTNALEVALKTYFPQVEEAIWSEFSGPFYAMKACSGTASSRRTWRCKGVNSRSKVCRTLPFWTSLLRAARLNRRKICSVVGWAQLRCSG